MPYIKNIILLVISLVTIAVALEICLHVFPVITVTRARSLELNSHPLDVAAIPNEEYNYSVGPLFKNSRTRKSNSQGFFSDYNYESGSRPIVVIGDSFVEALQVEFHETFHQLLGHKLGFKIYNFGISGAPLSQYEAYVQDVCERYRPNIIIISIVNNDFDQSFSAHHGASGFYHYNNNGEIEPTYYSLGLWKELANRSSLVKYVYFHLGVGLMLNNFTRTVNDSYSHEMPTDENYYSIHDRAAKIFLDNMKNYCVQPNEIIFIVDANRAKNGIYESEFRIPYMSDFIQQARQLGYRVLDLTGPFTKEYQESRGNQRFEFSFDGHWNKTGHRIVADELNMMLRGDYRNQHQVF
ncbi:SGNH/GDSL hydrolase family protein [Gammaproteobacteria bacterium]|nr:SGNH/GDSL hydrolase family protein [Gammaproteobacteria bacterium]